MGDDRTQHGTRTGATGPDRRPAGVPRDRLSAAEYKRELERIKKAITAMDKEFARRFSLLLNG